MRNITLLLLLVIIFWSCNEKKVDTKAEGEKIMQLSREWSKAASSGDLEKTLSYWAEDAIIMSAGDQPVQGKPAIRQMVEGSFKVPGFRISWQPQTIQVSESGDMAYMTETTQISYADSTGKVNTINNNAISIWRKQADGSWKNAVDISTPAPPTR